MYWRSSKEGRDNHRSIKVTCPLGTVSRANVTKSFEFNVDSGCSETLITENSINDFQIYNVIRHPIECANGAIMYGSKRLNLQCENFNLPNVMGVPNLSENLLSVRQLDSMGFSVIFTGGKVLVVKNVNCTNVVAEGKLRGKSYYITLNVSDKKVLDQCGQVKHPVDQNHAISIAQPTQNPVRTIKSGTRVVQTKSLNDYHLLLNHLNPVDVV